MRQLLLGLLALPVVAAGLTEAGYRLGGNTADAFIIQNRWTRTATNGLNVGPWGSAITVTWSLAPDNTLVPVSTTGTWASNNLLAFLDGLYGPGPGGSDLSLRPWFTLFEQAFDRISALSGVTYVYDPRPGGNPVLDDGVNFTSSNVGILGVRGDVRIGGRRYGASSNVLASNYFPNFGEMIFNTDQGSFFSNFSNNSRRLRNTIMHEAFHGLGIHHVESSNAAFLMEPFLQTSFDGPQLDDILALHRLYGDRYEKGGGNNTYHSATHLGTLAPAQPITIGTLGSSTFVSPSQVDFVSISGSSDVDYYSFTVGAALDVRLLLTPRGTTYEMGAQGGTQSPFNTLTLNDLALGLFDTNGTSLLAFANNNPAGLSEEILWRLLPGTYYARVTGSQNQVQLYGLNLTATTSPPKNLLWVGSANSNWTVGGAANFHDGARATVFFDLDHVRFDDTSAVRTVSVPDNVAPASMRVTTEASYRFQGAGAISANSLTVDGPGVVELANSGSSQYAAVQITGGTLRVSGAADFSGAVNLADATTLELIGPAATTAFATTSRLTGSGTVVGAVTMPGTIAPGSPTGTLTFAGHLTLASTSRLEIELADAFSYDVLDVAGTAALGGVLDVALTGGFLPTLDDSFEILRAQEGLFGQFIDVALPVLAPEFGWEVIYSNFAVLLQVIDASLPLLPGDFNGDGVVDAADYILWRKGFAAGEYGPTDYDTWRSNFGINGDSGSASSLASAVPEPTTVVLLLLALGLSSLAKRQR